MRRPPKLQEAVGEVRALHGVQRGVSQRRADWRRAPLNGTIEITHRCPLDVRALLQQPADGRPRRRGRASSRPRSTCRILDELADAGLPLAAVHRRRDLRAARLPRHLHARAPQGFPHHALHQRHAHHASDRGSPGEVPAVLHRDHALRAHARDLRAADRHSRVVRAMHARHRSAASSAVSR